MIRLLVTVYGVIPALLLALLAVFPLIGGIVMLLEAPTEGALLVAWGIAGIAGTRTLVQVASGTYTENTIPGLLAGITAAAPLLYATLQDLDMPGSWLPLYFTGSPIVVAAGYLADFVLFEPHDNAHIVEYRVE